MIGQKTCVRETGSTKVKGFTLVEILTVVVIVGILLAVGIPNYQQYVIKSKRSAAKGCLLEYSSWMERFYTTNLRYDKTAAGAAISFPALSCAGAGDTGKFYTYAFDGTPTKSGYKLKASPQGAQLADSKCGTLTLEHNGTKGASGSDGAAGCW